MLVYSSIYFQLILLDVHAFHYHSSLQSFQFFTQISKIHVAYFLFFYRLQFCSHLLFNFLAENFEPFLRMFFFFCWGKLQYLLLLLFVDSSWWLSFCCCTCNTCSGLNLVVWKEYLNSPNDQNTPMILLLDRGIM
jgi:hypothetical protein